MPIPGRHGIYDLSGLHFSQHASVRFAERVVGSAASQTGQDSWIALLRTCRKLGTNSAGDVAFLGMHQAEPFVLIVKGGVIVTVMTFQQFESVMKEFGRSHWPRRFGRWLRKLDRNGESLQNDAPSPSDEPAESS
jgi:hypothetical protein